MRMTNKVTPEDIEAAIRSEYYYTAKDGRDGVSVSDTVLVKQNDSSLAADIVELGLITHCTLILNNGFKVTGESACVDPANFDVEIGRKIARENAVQKIWPLLGYELKTKLNG